MGGTVLGWCSICQNQMDCDPWEKEPICDDCVEEIKREMDERIEKLNQQDKDWGRKTGFLP